MRTTLQIEDDVLQAARSLAQTDSKSLSQVISELARKGLRPQHREGDRSGFPVFDVPSDAFPITLERVKQAEEAQEEIAELRRLSTEGQGRSQGWRFDRDELHERS